MQTQYIVEKAGEDGEDSFRFTSFFVQFIFDKKDKPKRSLLLTEKDPVFTSEKALKRRFPAVGILTAIFFTFFAEIGQKTIEIT